MIKKTSKQKIREKVDELLSRNYTKSQAFYTVGKLYGLQPSSLANYYYGNCNRTKQRKYYYKSKYNGEGNYTSKNLPAYYDKKNILSVALLTK